MIRILLRILFVFFLVSSLTHGQVNKYGLPFITDFSTSGQNFGELNWCIVSDSRGIVYIGNNDNGVLQFNGSSWRAIHVRNDALVRSLATDSLDRVYVGAIGEFGFIEPDQFGTLQYRSLSEKLDSSSNAFRDVLKTWSGNGKVYFCTEEFIFVYDYKKVTKYDIPIQSFQSFLVGDRLYVQSYDDGLLEFHDGVFSEIKGGKFYDWPLNSRIRHDVVAILPLDNDNLLVTTSEKGAFVFNKETGISVQFLKTEAEKYLERNICYNAIKIHPDKFVFGTQTKGIIITDSQGELISVYNKNYGLKADEQITHIYLNQTGNQSAPLWITHFSGVSNAEILSPIRSFGSDYGINGQISDIITYNGKIYFGTTAGVQYLDYERSGYPVVKTITDIVGQCFSLEVFKFPGTGKEVLLAATAYGVYRIEPSGKAALLDIVKKDGKIEPLSNYSSKVKQSRIYPNTLLVGLDQGIRIIRWDGRRWQSLFSNTDNIQSEVRNMVEEKDGTLWMGTFSNGIFRLKYNEIDTVITKYGTEQGLPTLRDIFTFSFKGKILFATNRGIYSLDARSNSFLPDSSLGSRYSDGSRGVFQIATGPANEYWMLCHSSGVYWVEKAILTDNKWVYEEIPYKRLPNKGLSLIYCAPDGMRWFGVSGVLYNFDPTVYYNYHQTYFALINKIVVGQDSTVFTGNFVVPLAEGGYCIQHDQPEDYFPEFDFSNNNITFSFSAPYFESNEAIEYSYILEGFTDSWSRWSSRTEAVFTNLGPGEYTFKVKAKNVYGIESETGKYSFQILPPWYRTVVAYIMYAILSALFVWGIVKYNTRRLQQEKIRLEGIVQERTAEVVRQKEEIAAQRKDIIDSIRYASRIQKAVLPSEKVLNDLLPEHFILFKPRDIVSGDFYWMTHKDDRIYIVAADCTGHGVPGAFMSMLGMSFLNEIVNLGNHTQAADILNELRDHVIKQLKQTGKEDETKDGMDLALIIVDKLNKKIQFAGANNPLYLVRELTAEEIANPVKEEDLPRGAVRDESFELIQINADKMPIGISAHLGKPFTNTEIDYINGHSLYIASDGYEDQFGGPAGKKFLSKALKRYILKIQAYPMSEQRIQLEKNLEEWKGELEQVDDVLIMGVKLT